MVKHPLTSHAGSSYIKGCLVLPSHVGDWGINNSFMKQFSMMDWYIEFMILIFQGCFVTTILEIVTSQWNVSTSGLSESGPILKAVAKYCMGHWVLLLEVYEIFKDIEGFTLYLKSKFLISRCMNRRENQLFFSGIDEYVIYRACIFTSKWGIDAFFYSKVVFYQYKQIIGYASWISVCVWMCYLKAYQ